MKLFTKAILLILFVFSSMVFTQGSELIYNVTAKQINDNSNNSSWQDRAVKLQGKLTAQGQDENDFSFADGSGNLNYYVEFDQDITYPTTLNKDITIYAQLNIWFGGVNVNAHYWYYDDNPPSYQFEKNVNQVNSSMNNLPVILVGKITGPTSGGDNDQYDFQDSTGTIIADWDNDWGNPPTNQTITIYGLVDWYNQVLDIDMKSYVKGTASAIEDISLGKMPNKFELKQNYPNPFNPTTRISFSIPSSENVTLDVYNQIGQKVVTLLNSYLPAGAYEVEVTARDLPSGVYFYTVTAGQFNDMKKMILLK